MDHRRLLASARGHRDPVDSPQGVQRAGKKGKHPRITVVQKSEDKKLQDRYRLLFPECTFEYGGFEAFIETLPKPKKHYPVF